MTRSKPSFFRGKSARLAAPLLSAFLCGVAACGGDTSTLVDDRERTPDEIVAGTIVPGQDVVVRGRVTAITFPQEWSEKGESRALGTRYALLETSDAEQERSDGWGLAIELPEEKLASREWRLPQRGDEVLARGRLGTLLFDVEQVKRPVVQALSEYSVTKPMMALKLADLGEPCQRDLDCADDLWCERRGVCGKVPAITWSSDLRNINGTCLTDDDCPIGQRCDPSYKVQKTGDYRAYHRSDKDPGRFLCQVDRNAPPEALCPRPVAVEDFLGGRFPEGKEICVRAHISFPLLSPDDHDTHVQAEIKRIRRYPESQPSLDPFGAALENVPPYKDPGNALGAIADPQQDSVVDVIGTVHYDDGHGWWEVHPIKWVRKVSDHP